VDSPSSEKTTMEQMEQKVNNVTHTLASNTSANQPIVLIAIPYRILWRWGFFTF
jgi:hypothetical protein